MHRRLFSWVLKYFFAQNLEAVRGGMSYLSSSISSFYSHAGTHAGLRVLPVLLALIINNLYGPNASSKSGFHRKRLETV